MNFTPVANILEPAGFQQPKLIALRPTIENYRVLLLQPQGEIEGDAKGVRNRDRNLALAQFGCFLNDAVGTNADLAITPEYSLPWEVLASALKAGKGPRPGKLWALGCESITYSQLEDLKGELASFATLLYEQLTPNNERFLDPLSYVFTAPAAEGGPAEKPVVLVQFKTHPMGDDDHFEINGLQLGTKIYQFGGTEQSLRLVSLICSDAFAFKDADAKAVYDRALVIHVQLNPKPRQEQYRQYRERLLQFSGDETELICLNWARNVTEWTRESSKQWKNISASAWYLRPEGFDDHDKTINANHHRGLYYTWLQPLRVHALFLNFQPATYLLECTKVAHLAVEGSLSRRRGPQLLRMSTWDQAAGAWCEQVSPDAGFSAEVTHSGAAESDIKRIAEADPLAAERLLALCAGKIAKREDWYELRQLDSCVMDSSEIILRVTFCQDTKDVASDFRVSRLKRCGGLWEILKRPDLLPPALADFESGFSFEWLRTFPHQNAISVKGRRATVIYLGEEIAPEKIEAIAKWADDFLRRGKSGPDEIHSARQRLAVWFRDGDTVKLYDAHRLVQFDNTGTSEFDLGKEA